MDIVFCNEECPTGKAARNEFLDKSNSAFDAVTDFMVFMDECIKTCPYKELHETTAKNKEI